jgi:cytidylate kinase
LEDARSIAIDGPAASGKTSVGTLLARRLGYRFLDTGTMYRAVTLAAVKRGIDLQDEVALSALALVLEMQVVFRESGDRLLVDATDVTDGLRGPEIDRGVSLVARVSDVRTAMVRQQQAIARDGPIVMVGRDIGTVVLPAARVKVFLSASVEVRAQRRYKELHDLGQPPDYDRLVDDITRRDKIDSERSDSPMKPDDDALVIETDTLGVDQVAKRIMSLVESR